MKILLLIFIDFVIKGVLCDFIVLICELCLCVGVEFVYVLCGSVMIMFGLLEKFFFMVFDID